MRRQKSAPDSASSPRSCGRAPARLRVGGRLVFLMPFERENGALPELPLELPRCLELESLSHEPISKRLGRALVAMVKTREPYAAGIDA